MTEKPTYEELEQRVTELEKESVERKRIEERLEEKEQTLKALLNAPPETAILVDLEGTVLAINEVGAQRIGKSSEELIGLEIFDYLPRDMARTRKAKADEIVRTGTSVRFQDERDGRSYDNFIYPVFDAKERVTALAIYAKDITEAKRAGEALRESEERYRSLIHNIQAAVVVHDADTQIIACNSKAQELMGLTEDQMLGKTANDPDWKFLNADGERMSLKEYPVNQVLATRQPLRDFIAGVPRPNKVEPVWVLVNADPVFDYKGNIHQVIVTFMDITETIRAEEALQESEERFRLAFENANDGVCLVDTGGNLVKVNNRMSEIFGYDKKELESMTVNDIAHPEDKDISPDFIKKSKSGEVINTVFQKRYIHKQSHIIWGQVSSSIIKDARGDPLYFISHVQDITQKKQAEEALRESEEKYRNLVERANDGVIIVQNGKVQFSNTRLTDMFGYTIEEIINTPFLDYVVPNERNRIKELHEQRLKGEDVPDIYETQGLRKDGRKIDIETNSGIITYRKKPAVLAFIRDISERKRVEEALKENEERMRSVVESSPVGISIYNETGQCFIANDSLAEMVGATKEQVLQQNYNDIESWKISGLLNKAKSAIKENISKRHEVRTRSTFEQVVRLDCYLVPYSSGGLIFMAHDLTERMLAEEEREKLIKELQQALKEIKTLRGILPLCSFCKKIRDDKGYWEQVDVYIHKYSQADISHSICPECAKDHYPDLDLYE